MIAFTLTLVPAGATVEAFAGWVLQTGTMVAALLGLVLIIRRPFAKFFGAGATYALWAIPVARLFMPGLTWPRALTPDWLIPDPAPAPSPVTAYAPDIPSPAVPFDTTPPAPLPTAEIATTQGGVNLLTIGHMIWLSVAAIWLLRQLGQQMRWARAVNRLTDPCPASLASEIEAAKQIVGLKTTPLVRLSRDGMGPCVTGLFRPVVLLPQSFEQTFDPQQRQFALVHEFVHIRRGDLFAALAALIFRALNWPNPIVHWAVRAFRLDQEAACDATVMRLLGHDASTTTSYARTLVQAAKKPRSIPPARAIAAPASEYGDP